MAVRKPIPERLEGRLRSFAGGVHPPEHKEITEHLATERAPIPPEVVLPLSMHGLPLGRRAQGALADSGRTGHDEEDAATAAMGGFGHR